MPTQIRTLGDPHLGRRFNINVPLHRRGDRERMVVEHFKNHFAQLDKPDFHVCMGDIFDRPIVNPAEIKLVIDTYTQAIATNPGTQFVLLAGNHDLSRDLETVSSFDIVATWAQGKPTFHVVKDQAIEMDGMLFCPWHPFLPANLVAANSKADQAYGHWDVVNPSSPTNLVPIELPFKEFFTGHDHRRRVVGNINVIGSMQPYAHGEDDGQMYRTATLKELSSISDTRNLCLRVILAEGEELPDVDCLQLSALTEKEEQVTDLSVNLDGFDMTAIFSDTMKKHGVSGSLTDNLFEKYRNHGQ